MQKSQTQIIVTNYRVGRDGDGYVSDTNDNSYLIPLHLSKNALQKDTVEVEIDPTQFTGRVLQIVKRAKFSYRVSLDLSLDKTEIIATPTDAREGGAISITDSESQITQMDTDFKEKLNRGEKVYATVKITDFDSQPRKGEILEVYRETAGSMALSAATIRGFENEYPEEVLKEAEELVKNPPVEHLERKDLRHMPTFTIDPETSKDFDDALSVYRDENGEIIYGVHIADVSYVVQVGTALDAWAIERSTSVYLPGSTQHMLPPVFAENLCSLRPHEDRKAMTVLFKQEDKNSRPKAFWIGPSIIESKHRFTYEEVDDVLEGQSDGPFKDELFELNRIALLTAAQRRERGALFLASVEVKPVLNDEGYPIAFKHSEATQSHSLVEEWMLLANTATAEKVTELNRGIYRVHPMPTEERIERLADDMTSLGIKTSKKELMETGGLTRLLDSVKGNEILTSIVSTSIAQTQEKAFYTTDHVPHCGLALDTYTHFTSPIRRFPDILVHRAIKQEYTKDTYFPYTKEETQAMLNNSTEQERRAQGAEREAISMAHAQYWQAHINKPIQFLIRSISRAGVFATETETLADGRINTFDRNKYFLNANEHTLELKKTKQVLRPGMLVKGFVSETSLTEGQITFELM